MIEKVYLYLLIFCGFLCQGIIASLSASDIRNSSDFLVRNKRVINHEPGGLNPTKIEILKYIVNIKRGTRTICVGSILSHYTIITAISCTHGVTESELEILSGSGYTPGSQIHTVTSISRTYGNAQYGFLNGIALFTVDPPFVFNRKTGTINLYTGPVLPGLEFEVSGWGCFHPLSPPWNAQRRLRSITVPIIPNPECTRDYQGVFAITSKNICTYHENKYCAHTDIGAPLVFTNKLAGIHVFKGENRNKRNPDVFLNLQIPEFANWIRQHTILM